MLGFTGYADSAPSFPSARKARSLTQADPTTTPSTAAPILDSAVLPPLKRRRKLGIVVGVAIGCAIGAWLGNDYKDVEPGHPQLLAIISVFVLAVVVHELGHLFAGWLVGFHFTSFGIGPVVATIEHGRLKVRIRTGTGYSGYVSMQVGTIRRLRRRFLIYVVGGPGANLLSVPVMALLVNHVFPAWSHSWLAIPAGEFAAISFFIGSLGFLPLGDGSDGQRIAMLMKRPVAARRLLSCLALANQYRNGVRPKLWRRTWLRAASEPRDGLKDEFSGKWAAYSSANDGKDAPLAAACLERCLEIARGRGSKVLDHSIREAAVFCAWFRQDATLAEKWLTQVKRPRQISPLVKFRIDVAILSVRQEYAQCLELWQKGLSFIDNMPTSPNRNLLRDQWLEWRTEIEERQQHTAGTTAAAQRQGLRNSVAQEML